MMDLFKTKRTKIRSFQQSDLHVLLEMMSDPLVMKFTGFKKPQSEEKIRELLENWIQSSKDPLGVWAAEEIHSAQFIACPHNLPSIKVLTKIGMKKNRNVTNDNGLLYFEKIK